MRSGIIVPGLASGSFACYPGAERTGGVPSGSVLTNLIDSLVNLWVMYYSAHRLGSRVLFALSQGDDGVYTFQGYPSKADLSGVISELGMTMSEEKSMMSTECVHFLQNLHTRRYLIDGLSVGQRPFTHILNSAMSMERDDGKEWNRDCHTIRWLQQWSEGDNHPSFHEACDWLYESDWMCKGILCRLCDDDTTYLSKLLACVSRKDSNAFFGLSVQGFLTSPVIQYLKRRMR